MTDTIQPRKVLVVYGLYSEIPFIPLKEDEICVNGGVELKEVFQDMSIYADTLVLITSSFDTSPRLILDIYRTLRNRHPTMPCPVIVEGSHLLPSSVSLNSKFMHSITNQRVCQKLKPLLEKLFNT